MTVRLLQYRLTVHMYAFVTTYAYHSFCLSFSVRLGYLVIITDKYVAVTVCPMFIVLVFE